MHFRELALLDGDRRFAAVAEQIIDRVAAAPASFATPGYSVGEFLAEALAYPDLTALLPRPVEPVTSYEKFIRGSQLVRIRRDNIAASIFGGTDWHNRRVDSAGNPPPFARSPPGCPPIRRSSSSSRARRSWIRCGCHPGSSAPDTSAATG